MRIRSPRSHVRILTLLVLLVSSALSGCLGDETTTPAEVVEEQVAEPDLVAPDGRDLATELTAEDELPAPVWRVGDWWGLHFYFGSDPGNGNHVNAVVTESASDEHYLATDDQQVAKFQALRDLPVLGAIGADDLSSTGFGGDWDLLEFPLKDGATWTGEIPNIAFDILPEGQVPIDFTATYVSEIDIDGKSAPGYVVEGMTEDGTLIVSYTYAPAVRWFTSLTVYDIDPEQDPLEFTVMLMGHGRDWIGTYYIDEATVLVENFDGSGFTDVPTEGGEPFASVSPHVTFTVSAEATYVFGFVGNVAVFGARTTILFPPEGDPRHYEAVGAPEQGVGTRIDEPAIAGEWRLVTAGAGAATFSEVFLVGLVETTGTL
ncbi:MAG: hypothetical protein KY455_10240 [Euryarchaeota archaeon]|nr:hypothetical protein [Euryarchaeota archaeon]